MLAKTIREGVTKKEEQESLEIPALPLTRRRKE
jgi:hypothetical protein